MSKEMPFIEVVIPYEPCKKFGFAANRVMEKAHDWVFILDHDLFICNPNWYEAFLYGVQKVGHGAGWITGVTNRTACSNQRAVDAPIKDNLVEHVRYAEKLWQRHGPEIIEVQDEGFTTFNCLTHKEAWKKVGGFDVQYHFDSKYCSDLRKHGYKMFVMPGVYFYHFYTPSSKIDGEIHTKQSLWGWNSWKPYGTEWKVL